MFEQKWWMKAGLGIAMSALALPAQAETLASDKRISVVLDDQTQVTLYGAVGNGTDGKTDYYYLPPRLSLSTNEEGSPEFMFMKFITDESEDNGGVSGAILHFLVEWGLTSDQEEELSDRLEDDFDGNLAGAATMLPSNDEGPTFYLVSGTLSDGGLGDTSLVTSGQAALVPGGKAAAASRMDSNAAEVLATTFEEDSNITDVTAVMNMQYAVLVEGVQGTVTVDWSKIAREAETIRANYERTLTPNQRKKTKCFIVWCRDNTLSDYTYSYDEVQSQFSFLSENEYVSFEFQQGDIPEEVAAPVRDAFIQYFIAAVTEASEPTPPPPARDADDEEEEEPLNIRQGAGYTYNSSKLESRISRGSERLDLDVDITVRYPYTLVGNMKSWYTLAAEDPYKVQEVLLADKFFDRRDILFVLDGNVEDIFEDHVNMVTVEVQKDRGDQPAFEDSRTFTRGNLGDEGTLRSMTYARLGDEPNSGTYQYRTQWNFRGGKRLMVPQDGWETGSWEGITLAAPVEARTIELEGDLEELEEAGFTRVTAQVRYPLFGEEEEENIQLTVSRGNALVENTMVMDADAGGYVYRIVLNHKRLGRLALPWSKRASDNYIYASIPGEFLDDIVNEVIDGIVGDAQAAVTEDDGDQLSKFNILLGED